MIKIGLQEIFFWLFRVVGSDNFNCFISNNCKGNIQGQKVIFSRSISINRARRAISVSINGLIFFFKDT